MPMVTKNPEQQQHIGFRTNHKRCAPAVRSGEMRSRRRESSLPKQPSANTALGILIVFSCIIFGLLLPLTPFNYTANAVPSAIMTSSSSSSKLASPSFSSSPSFPFTCSGIRSSSSRLFNRYNLNKKNQKNYDGFSWGRRRRRRKTNLAINSGAEDSLPSGSVTSKAQQRGSSSLSRFVGVPMQPLDPVFGLNEAFAADSNHALKLNLGVGAYRTEELQPYVLNVVKEAERRIVVERSDINKEYLPIDGLPEFRKAAAEVLWGREAWKDPRIAVIQSISGTGSLRLGAEFFTRFMPGKSIFISNPTWANHRNIFEDASMKVEEYRYWDPSSKSLDISGMLEDLRSAPEGSIILLHACAHNPTGVDPTPHQWRQVADIVRKNNLFPFFDVAYQGFVSGDLDRDAYVPRLFKDMDIELVAAQSFAKNLGLYSERIGTLQFFLADGETASRVQSQCKRIGRAIYSNPPAHGARVVAEVLGDEQLRHEWEREIKTMASRILEVRSALSKCLNDLAPDRDWGYITEQKGMFTYTGLTEKQVAYLRNHYHIYMMKSGRISMAGLPISKAEYLAKAILDVINNV